MLATLNVGKTTEPSVYDENGTEGRGNSESDELDSGLPQAGGRVSFSCLPQSGTATNETNPRLRVETSQFAILDTNVRTSPPKVVLRARAFQVLQQWEGVVTEIYEHSFWAMMSDLSPRSSAQQVVELLNLKVPEQDQSLIAIGNVFYLIVGYEQKSGTIRKSVEIRFRRWPTWTQNAVSEAARNARLLLEEFKNDADAQFAAKE